MTIVLAEGLRPRHDGTVRHRLAPASSAGQRACALAEQLARRWAPSAHERDRTGRFDPALVKEVQLSGLAGGCVPAELGGGDVELLRDVMAIVHRLAEADGSLALVVHMHLSGTWGLARAHRAAQARRTLTHIDDERTALLTAVARGDAWLSAAVTEAGTNFFHPRATLEARADGGWVLHGTKVFATGSPAATHFSANAHITAGPDAGHLAHIIVPARSPGVEVVDDWDGLGMRASGSGVVRFEHVELPAHSIVSPGGPYGCFSAASLCGRAFGNVGNVTAMAGLAAAAEALAVARVTGEHRVGEEPLARRPTVRASLAELEADAFALDAIIVQLATRADEVSAALLSSPEAIDDAAARAFMAEFQAAKLNVNRLSTAVVDRALSLAGGRGYQADHALARLTRDVRAGQFMQPFSPHEGLGFLGAVAAGVDPDVEA